MNLNNILPNAANRVSKTKHDAIIYIATVKWGWTWQQFLDTPIPVIMILLRQWQKEQKELNKQNGKR